MQHLCDWWMISWSCRPLRNRVQIVEWFFKFLLFQILQVNRWIEWNLKNVFFWPQWQRVLHFLLMSSCLGRTKQMFALEVGFIWRGGRKHWEICYWHLIPDVSVDLRPIIFCLISLFFLSFLFFFFWLLLAGIYVKWTEVIIIIWQGSWKYRILFLILLTVLLINPSPLIHLIGVRFFMQVFKTWNWMSPPKLYVWSPSLQQSG